MASPFVVFCESNLKGGVACALGPKTLIVGPNGSGKSSVCNVVELALTGRVSDLAGRRDVAKEAELQALAPGRKGELLARVALSDGTEALWKAGGKGSKKAKHQHPATVDPACALPLRPVYEAVLGSVETARKFFLGYAVGAVTDADVLNRIPAALHARYRRATLAGTLSTGSVTDKLLFVLEHAKKQKREVKGRVKAAEEVAAESAQGLPPLPTDAAVKALTAALRDAEKVLDQVKEEAAKWDALQNASTQREAAAARVNGARAALAEAEGAHAAAVAALNALPPAAYADPDVAAVVNAIRVLATKGYNVCLCCGQPVDHTGDTFKQRLATVEQHLAGLATASAQRRAAEVAATVAAANAANARSEVEKAEAALQALVAAAGEQVARPTDEMIGNAESEVARLRHDLQQVDVLKARWESVTRAKDGAGEAEKESKEWEDLAEACVDAIARLLDAGVAGFVSRVQQALPPADQFDLTLREGERAVFQLGLKKGGTVHTALSGAEWARVTAAMAGVCRPPAGKVSVVIPEDRAYDPATLALVLAAFGNLDSQVLVCSPVPPAGVPAGWTVINTGAEEHRAGAPAVAQSAPADVMPVGVATALVTGSLAAGVAAQQPAAAADEDACSVCGAPTRLSSRGIVCANGHGEENGVALPPDGKIPLFA